MKKSKLIKIGLLAAIASTILACDAPTQYQECTDALGNVVAESQCTGHIPGFVYYYSSSPFYYGSRVYGGGYVSHTTNITNVYHSSSSSSGNNSGSTTSTTSKSNTSGSTITSSPISRGGFGSTGSSMGSSSS
jgi:hypothetical protein